MNDGAFPDRLTQLKNRWDADPTSRVFLQLAEEYRHQGRVKEALAVLDRGLKEHPGYLSALVAKGRCHLELGEPEPAREVLERVVKQDATQMVANKLLVRAYLDTGEADRARERLDLYSLLNDSDPEIEELRRRLRVMEQPPQQPPTTDSLFPEAASRGAAAPARADVFDLGLPAATQPAGAQVPDEPFADLWKPPAAPPAPPTTAPAPRPSPPPGNAVSSPPPALERAAEVGVVFPGLASQEGRSQYLRALASEGLFIFDLPPEDVLRPASEAREPAAPAAPENASAGAEGAASGPVAEVALGAEAEPLAAEPDAVTSRGATIAGFSWERVEEEVLTPEPAAVIAPPEPAAETETAAPAFAIEEPVAADPMAGTPASPPPAAEAVATVTLGELYLRQDHPGEAKKIFEEVLRREPDNAAAREGLAELASRQRPLAARDLLAGYEPGEEGGEGEARSRKRFLLNSYLRRLRRGRQRDVS